jgi:chlorite dismutase
MAPVKTTMPAVPLTLDGSAILHQMFRVRWQRWKELDASSRKEIVAEAKSFFEGLEGRKEGQSGLFTLLGHKGDLMSVHFRRSFDELSQAELALTGLRLADFLEQTTSYLSVVELGLYEFSVRLYGELKQRGLQEGTPEWNQAVEEKLEEQRRVAAPRLWPVIPPRKYVCFYPMNKLRGEDKNWYRESIQERQRMMADHGVIGRRYAGRVTQIISGSIGFDDWEWGVDLFADDPLIFKKLVYEMRFDEASANYGLFGAFYFGLRLPAAQLDRVLDGQSGSSR